MRRLFVSEARCVNNIMRERWHEPNGFVPTIVSEYVADPENTKRRPWFNCDFRIEFVDRFVTWPESMAACVSVLPNALGAELFLTIAKENRAPMSLELIGAQAFTIKYYASFIQQVEAAVQQALAFPVARQLRYSWQEWLRLVPIKKSAFARVLVVGGEITFLYFPTDGKPVMRGELVNLVQQDGREINIYIDQGQLVCFDGWMRTEIDQSEMKFVATRE